MLQSPKERNTAPKFLLYLLFSIRLRLAYLALALAVSCHRHLTDLLNLFCPALPESEDPESEASKAFASWTPTTQTVFAVVPPDHEIRGPGEFRKLRVSNRR